MIPLALLRRGSSVALVPIFAFGLLGALPFGGGGAVLQLELPRPYLTFDPDLPEGAESFPDVFLVRLDGPTEEERAPRRVDCVELVDAGPAAGAEPGLARFTTATLNLEPGLYELFLAQAGFAQVFEYDGEQVLGHAPIPVFRVPEPVLLHVLPLQLEGAPAQSPARLAWRCEPESQDAAAAAAPEERLARCPMSEAWPAPDGIGFQLLTPAGRLRLEFPGSDWTVLGDPPVVCSGPPSTLALCCALQGPQ